MKQFLFKITTGIACIAFFMSCNHLDVKTTTSSDALNMDSVKAAIAASNKVYGQTFAKNDSATFVGCYTSDACINPSNAPQMCGKDAINAFFKGGVQMGIKNVVLTTKEVMGSREAMVETGTYEIMVDGNKSVDKGKFIVVWKEENGKWKMHRDIWNTDMPVPAPAK